MTKADPAVSVSGLHKSFGVVDVLNGIDLEIPAGTVFALLGSNGAGKTTMIRILCTLLRADFGTAIVNGFDVNQDPDGVRQSISLTGQFAAVDGILTGRENLELTARLRQCTDPKKTADALLRSFRLASDGDRRAAEYSGGMRRRLDIAMSLVGDVPIIFLDEPTTGLDPASRREVWDTIRQLARAGHTIFLTTQYLDEAQELADHIAILHEGKILVHGTLADLRRLLPTPKKVLVEQQPSLEDIFLTLTTEKGA